MPGLGNRVSPLGGEAQQESDYPVGGGGGGGVGVKLMRSSLLPRPSSQIVVNLKFLPAHSEPALQHDNCCTCRALATAATVELFTLNDPSKIQNTLIITHVNTTNTSSENTYQHGVDI